MGIDLAALDNVIWNALAADQAPLARGGGSIRRFAPGYTPLIGAREPSRPDLASIASHCEPGEALYVFDWTGPVPGGWAIEDEAMLMQMVWAGADGDPAPATFRALGHADLPAVLALVDATHPGPFGPRTIEMGSYFGAFEDGRLVAMTGERLHVGLLREVSGVCTAPDRQGRGIAGRLVQQVARLQRSRGQWPFLHVMADNHAARRVYERVGFRRHREFVARIVCRHES